MKPTKSETAQCPVF